MKAEFDFVREEVEIFLSRAKKFEELASVAFEKRMYDIAAFHIEQSLQLYLKYIFAKEVGYFPKTHSLKNFLSKHQVSMKNLEIFIIKMR